MKKHEFPGCCVAESGLLFSVTVNMKNYVKRIDSYFIAKLFTFVLALPITVSSAAEIPKAKESDSYQMRNPFCAQNIYDFPCPPPVRNIFFGISLDLINLGGYSLSRLDKSSEKGSGLEVGISSFWVTQALELYVTHVELCIDCETFFYRYRSTDIRIRKYPVHLNKDGAYVGGAIRVTQIHAPILHNYDGSYVYASEEKIGIGIERGFRHFLTKKFYIGAGLLLGWYIKGANDKFMHKDISDVLPGNFGFIFDGELKVGYAF